MNAREHAEKAAHLLEPVSTATQGTVEYRALRAADAQAHALTAIALELTGRPTMTIKTPDGSSRAGVPVVASLVYR